MTFKVTFNDNVPCTVMEATTSVVIQKKWRTINGIKEFDWILVEAITEEDALIKANKLVEKEMCKNT